TGRGGLRRDVRQHGPAPTAVPLEGAAQDLPGDQREGHRGGSGYGRNGAEVREAACADGPVHADVPGGPAVRVPDPPPTNREHPVPGPGHESGEQEVAREGAERGLFCPENRPVPQANSGWLTAEDREKLAALVGLGNRRWGRNPDWRGSCAGSEGNTL